MLTIDETANKNIEKAKRMLNKAIETLTESAAYNNRGDIFHVSTVRDVNRIITAIQTLND